MGFDKQKSAKQPLDPSPMNGKPQTNRQVVFEVNENSVLFGRGAPSIDNVGNVRFRELVKARKHSYLSTRKRQLKEDLALEVIRRVEQRGGKFLRKIESLVEAERLGVPKGKAAWYVEVDTVVLQKVKQAFRERDSLDPPTFVAGATTTSMFLTSNHDGGQVSSIIPYINAKLASNSLCRRLDVPCMLQQGPHDANTYELNKLSARNDVHQLAGFLLQQDLGILEDASCGADHRSPPLSSLAAEDCITLACARESALLRSEEVAEHVHATLKRYQRESVPGFIKSPSAGSKRSLTDLVLRPNEESGELSRSNDAKNPLMPMQQAINQYPESENAMANRKIRRVDSRQMLTANLSQLIDSARPTVSQPLLVNSIVGRVPCYSRLPPPIFVNASTITDGEEAINLAIQHGWEKFPQIDADHACVKGPNLETFPCTLFEAIILSALCDLGHPVWGLEDTFSWRHVAGKMTEIAVERIARRQNVEGAVGRIRMLDRTAVSERMEYSALKLVSLYKQVPKQELAKRSVMFLQGLRKFGAQFANLDTDVKPVASDSGYSASSWFRGELRMWANTLAVSQHRGGSPVPFAWNNFRDSRQATTVPGSEFDYSTAPHAFLGQQSCDRVFCQIANLTLLRSLVLETRLEKLLSAIAVILPRRILRWENAPSWWNNGDEAMHHDAEMMTKLINVGYSKILDETIRYGALPNNVVSIRALGLTQSEIQFRVEKLVAFLHRLQSIESQKLLIESSRLEYAMGPVQGDLRVDAGSTLAICERLQPQKSPLLL